MSIYTGLKAEIARLRAEAERIDKAIAEMRLLQSHDIEFLESENERLTKELAEQRERFICGANSYQRKP